MGDDVEIRAGHPTDRDRILDLVRLSLGEGTIPRHAGYWRWKHELNVFGPSACLLAVAEDQLVGLRVFMRWSWSLGDGSVAAVRAVDTATHPDWRGRGIFSRLTLALLEEMEDEGVRLVFNTPNEKSRPGYLKMGWVQVGRASLWLRPLRPQVMVAALRERASGDSKGDGSRRDPYPTPGLDAAALCREPALPSFLESVARAADRLHTPLSTSYLEWRYALVPDIRYRAVWRIDGHEGAVVIFRMKRRGAALELRLCEVVVGSGSASRRMARGLLRGLISESGADYAAAMSVTGAPTLAVLGPTGFVPAPRLGPIMTVRPITSEPAVELDPTRRSSWRLSIGDLELF